MSLIKRAAALVCVVSILSLFAASCHKKGEIAMEIDGVKISGSLYFNFMVQADSDARNSLSSSDQSGNSSLPSNYQKESIDGKSYSAWMEERITSLCRDYALTENLFKKYKLSFTDDEKYMIDYYAQYYWSYYYQTIYELNGISFETFRTVMENSEKKNKIFTYYYDQGGTKEVPEAERKTALEKLYVLADSLEISFTTTDDEGNETTMTDEQKTEKKKELEGYLTRLNKESFEKVKEDFDKIYNPPEEEDTSSSDPASSEAASSDGTSSAVTSEEEEENSTPMDENKNAVAYGSSESQTSSTAYEKVLEMKAGEKKVIELDDKVILAVRKDILTDPYYLKYYNAEVLSYLKNDEFTKDFEKKAGKLKINEHSYVTNLYNPSKVKYPES